MSWLFKTVLEYGGLGHGQDFRWLPFSGSLHKVLSLFLTIGLQLSRRDNTGR